MMRQATQIYWPPLTPTVKKLLIITGICFILQYVIPVMLDLPFVSIFALIPVLAVQKFFLWQLVTYMFLHGGILHLIVNMLMLWMFGGELESYWGSKRFLIFYLSAGVFAGIISIISYFDMKNPIVGASGGIYALLIAYGFMFPNRRLLFFGIFPMQTKYFVMLVCLMTFWVAFSEGGGNVAHFAHIGGIFFGIIYMKFGQWINIAGRYRNLKKEARKNKLKSRFKVITNDIAKDKIDNFWDSHKNDNPPGTWN